MTLYGIYSSNTSAHRGGNRFTLFNKTSINRSKASSMHCSSNRFLLVSGGFFDVYLISARGSKFFN